MGKKPIRKNFYRNSAHKRTVRIKQSLFFTARAAFAILVMMGMSLFFILGHDYITQCDYFKARQLTVSGFQRLSEQLIIKQAGLGPGINTLAVNLALARKKLLAHPWIEEAELTRNLPGRIEIRVTEHQPLAILDLQRKFILNTKGKIFKEWSPADPLSLPVISGLEFSDLNIDPNSKTTPFQAAITVLDMGGSQGSILPNQSINRIHVDREIGLTLYILDQSKAIKLGYNNYSNKLNQKIRRWGK